MPFDHATEAILSPYWDIDARVSNGAVDLKGLLLIGSNHSNHFKDEKTSKSCQAFVLVLKFCEDHYERIGIVELPSNPNDRVAVSFRVRTGSQQTTESSSKKIKSIERDDKFEPHEEVLSTRWWWNAFKPETILLR